MHKDVAIRLLGGKTAEAARAIGVSNQAVAQWPDVLPPRIEDRVLAALARKHLPQSILLEAGISQTKVSAKAGHAR